MTKSDGAGTIPFRGDSTQDLPTIPRCFAVEGKCPHHIATVPTYVTQGAMSPELRKWSCVEFSSFFLGLQWVC